MNNVPFLGKSIFESVGVCLLKDSSLMGIFPFPPLDALLVATLNMISTQVRQSLELYDPLVVPDYEKSYFHVSSSLKNETTTSLIESSLFPDLVNIESSLSPDLINVESILSLDLVT